MHDGVKPAFGKLMRTENDIVINVYPIKSLDGEFIERLTDFNQLCFPPCTREDCKADMTERSDFVHVAVDRGSGEIIGIAGEAAITSEGRGVHTYLSFSGVAESARGRGVYQKMVRSRIMHSLSEGITEIMIHTQNANVENGIRHALDKLAAEGILEGYEISRKINPGRMGKYGVARPAGSAPLESRYQELNKEYEALNADNGDAFEITIRIKPAA